MKRDLLEVLRCPECAAFPLASETFDEAADGEIVDGVVWCRACLGWYPVEDRVLELLQRSLAYVDDRRRFWEQHRATLEGLGLSAFVPGDGCEDASEQRSQQQHFDWYSDNDTQTYTAFEQMRFWQLVDRKVFDTWCDQIEPGGRLLDVGCAQGRSTFKVRAPGTTVIGFDVSKRLVAQAIARARRKPSMHFFVGDATRMPIVDGSFDYVLIYGVLHHLPKPANICLETWRVLKPGGLFFCSENNETVLHPMFEWLQKVCPIWYEEAGEHSHIHPSELLAWLEQAGFRAQVWSGVFVPPHLLNVLPARIGRDLLYVSDRLLTSIPWVRDQGGLIVSTSVKTGQLSQTGTHQLVVATNGLATAENGRSAHRHEHRHAH